MELRRILKEEYDVKDSIFTNPSNKSLMIANTLVHFFTYEETDKLRGYVSDFVTDDESPNILDRIAHLKFKGYTLKTEIEELEKRLNKLQKEQNAIIERLHFENRALI